MYVVKLKARRSERQAYSVLQMMQYRKICLDKKESGDILSEQKFRQRIITAIGKNKNQNEILEEVLDETIYEIRYIG